MTQRLRTWVAYFRLRATCWRLSLLSVSLRPIVCFFRINYLVHLDPLIVHTTPSKTVNHELVKFPMQNQSRPYRRGPQNMYMFATTTQSSLRSSHTSQPRMPQPSFPRNLLRPWGPFKNKRQHKATPLLLHPQQLCRYHRPSARPTNPTYSVSAW